MMIREMDMPYIPQTTQSISTDYKGAVDYVTYTDYKPISNRAEQREKNSLEKLWQKIAEWKEQI